MMAYLLGFGIPIGYITIGVLTSLFMFRYALDAEIREGWEPKAARRRLEGDPVPMLAGIFWPVMPAVFVVWVICIHLIQPLFKKPTSEEIVYAEKKAIEAAKEVVYGKSPAEVPGKREAQDYIRDYIRSMD